MDAALCRRLLGPDKILGVSAQSPAQAQKAQRDGADYIGCGAVFPTQCALLARSFLGRRTTPTPSGWTACGASARR